MTYEALYDQLWDTKDQRPWTESYWHNNFPEDAEEESTEDDDFFKPKGMKKRIKERFNKVVKCVLVTSDPGKDILEYLRASLMFDVMQGHELMDRLFEGAFYRDRDLENAYGAISMAHYIDPGIPTSLNVDLVSNFKDIFITLVQYLRIPDNFDANLLKYLVDNFRWIVPVVKREEDFLSETGKGIMEQPF